MAVVLNIHQKYYSNFYTVYAVFENDIWQIVHILFAWSVCSAIAYTSLV